MKDAILLELADRWDRQATDNVFPEDGSDAAIKANGIAQGRRECKRECADTIRTLIEMLGE